MFAIYFAAFGNHPTDPAPREGKRSGRAVLNDHRSKGHGGSADDAGGQCGLGASVGRGMNSSSPAADPTRDEPVNVGGA